MSLLELTARVRELGKDVLTRVGHLNASDPLACFKSILLYFTLRSNQTVDAIVHLIKGGYTDQALALSRNIVEMAINAVYMSRDPVTLGQRYVEYHSVARKKWLDADRRHFGGTDALRDPATGPTIEEIEQGANEFKQRYGDPEPRNWSGKSIAKMAREAGGSVIYELAYGYSCESGHPGVLRATDYFELAQDGKIWMKDGPDPKHQDAALANACSCLLLILSHLDEQLALGCSPRIDALSEEMKRQGG